MLGKDAVTEELETDEQILLNSRESVKRLEMSRGIFFAILIFVAIPLPGTGAWTGSLIAALLGMRLRYALPSILLGVLTAGFLMTGASYGFFGFLDFIL